MKLQYFLVCIPCIVQASPVSVSDGGTGLVTLGAANRILYAASDLTMTTLAIGTNGQALTVSGGVPTWDTAPAALPGYTAATGFAYAGSTSTIATSSSANRSMWISTNVPSAMTSSAVDNTVIGYNALNAVTSGTANTVIGSGALAKGTGSSNTVIGYQAGANTTTGAPNTAIGYQALIQNVSGANNTACGYLALQQTLGSGNTVVGHNSFSNATGSYNTGMGHGAGNASGAVSAGDSNTCIGALTSGNTTVLGSSNVMIGSLAGQSNRASNSVGVGVQVLTGANTGTNNTGFGNQVLNLNTSGANNCGVGHQSLNACVSGSQNTACGSVSLNKITSSDSTAVGYNSLNAVTTNAGGSRMTALGASSGSTVTTGTNNIYLGYNSVQQTGITESNNTVIGNSSTATAYMFGISGVTSAGATNMVINASALLGTIVSSERFKENIVEVTQEELDALLALNVVRFNYVDDDTHEIHYGLIAEDVYEIMPDIVIKNNQGQVFSVQYDKLIGLLIYQVQKQQKNLDNVTSDIAMLQKSITEILKA